MITVGYPDSVCSCVHVNAPGHEFSPQHITQPGGNSGTGLARAPGTLLRRLNMLLLPGRKGRSDKIHGFLSLLILFVRKYRLT